MKEKYIQIILLLAAAVGAYVIYYMVLKKRKRAIIEISPIWGYYKIGSENINPDADDHYSQIFFVDNLVKIFGTSRKEFYELNPDLNKQITSLPYGWTVLLPRKQQN